MVIIWSLPRKETMLIWVLSSPMYHACLWKWWKYFQYFLVIHGKLNQVKIFLFRWSGKTHYVLLLQSILLEIHIGTNFLVNSIALPNDRLYFQRWFIFIMDWFSMTREWLLTVLVQTSLLPANNYLYAIKETLQGNLRPLSAKKLINNHPLVYRFERS